MARSQLKGSITVRVSAPLQKRFNARARQQGKTPSDLLRALMEQEVAGESVETGPTVLEMLGDLVGAVSRSDLPPARTKHLKVRDRRG